MKNTSEKGSLFIWLLLCIAVTASGCRSTIRFSVFDAQTNERLRDYSVQWGQVAVGFPKASSIIETNLGTIVTTNILKIDGIHPRTQNAFKFKKDGYQNACVTIAPNVILVNTPCDQQTNRIELSVPATLVAVPLYRSSTRDRDSGK